MPVRDEIGDLADAFNRVQTTAAALLERQVLSRRNVAEMFGNVGRRVSNLTARQLALIDAVERGETDPELLDRLYRIDHLAVRLQRNADSLMLLAGIRETGLDDGPTALTNVVRAALGQIEGYQRVSPRGRRRCDGRARHRRRPDADARRTAGERRDVLPRAQPRRGRPVRARAAERRRSIEISDHGLGMSAERLAEENARLIRRERLDLVPTKVLGLFVVGSLARRWGISVTLIPHPGRRRHRSGSSSRPSLLLLMSPFTRPAQDAEATGGAGTAAGETAAHGGPARLARRRIRGLTRGPRHRAEATGEGGSGSEGGDRGICRTGRARPPAGAP